MHVEANLEHDELAEELSLLGRPRVSGKLVVIALQSVTTAMVQGFLPFGTPPQS